MNLNIPLELQTKDFGKLDKMQINLMCKSQALDLVILENANEIFRIFIQEGHQNNNIEKLLKLVSKENKRSLFLPSITFNVNQNKKGNWFFTQTNKNKSLLKGYNSDCNIFLNNKIKNNSILFTIIGLDLGEGGHYGALICDIEKRNVIVFDSMSGEYDGGYYASGVENVFIKLAKQIFLGDQNYKGIDYLNKISGEFIVGAINTSYPLQPTGGFENFISPELKSINKPGKKRLVKQINIQHTDSQNHFCYIWSIWFIQIYLTGGEEKYNTILDIMKKNNMIPIIVIKKYILSFINILGNINYSKFFYKRFPQIWSNYGNPLENNFHLYSFNYKICSNISECLENSILDYEIKKERKTNNKIC